MSTARRVLLVDLIVSEHMMIEVLASGRVSDTPDVPIFVNVRADGAGLEIADGCHRVAAAVRAGALDILVDIDSVPDDEPYRPPFYRFNNSYGTGH